MRSQWQIDQGNACGCKGHDEWCGCQNVNRSEPEEYPPSPDAACRQKADRVNRRLREMLNYRGILPGHADTLRAAIAEIDNLASSYLACSADNDRLRALVENETES